MLEARPSSERTAAFHPRDLEQWKFCANADILKKLYNAESALAKADESVRHFRYRDALNNVLTTLDALASARIAGIHVTFNDVFEGECNGPPEREGTTEASSQINRQNLLLNKTLSFKRSLLQIKKIMKVPEEITEELLFALYGDLNNYDATLKESALVDYRQESLRATTPQNEPAEGNPNTYRSPAPHEIPGLMKNLLAFCNEEYASPLLQVVVAHFRFEAISPFEYHMDHIGRLLCQMLFFKRGLSQYLICPIALCAARRPDIHANRLFPYRCKDSSFNNDLDKAIFDFVDQCSLSLVTGVQVTLTLKEIIQRAEDSWERQLGLVRSDSALRAILDTLPATPVFSMPYMVQRTGRSKTAINAALHQLEQAKIIQQVTSSKRNRSFEVPFMIELFKRIQDTVLPDGVPSRESFSFTVSDTPAVFRS